MKISIVVVAWRSRSHLAPCLNSLTAHATDCQIVVVDNASGDGTTGWVKTSFPDVELVALPENVGFAAGCNLGAARATGDLLLFLNPDASALQGSVHSLASALAADESAAVAGGLLVNHDGLPQARYGPRSLPSPMDLMRNILVGGRPRGLPAVSGPPRQVGQVAGAALMARRDTFQRLGGFDSSFHPVFFEDVDFCLRVSQAGHKVLHVPSAPFAHQGGASVRLMTAGAHYAAWFDNLHRYALKHHGPGTAALLRGLTLPGATLRLGSTVLPGGGGSFGRGPRAAACLQIALRSINPWHPASQSTS
jgi:N-acetylglucosaminyl-diphospho-decaprenol L-rhamnosyltransferase